MGHAGNCSVFWLATVEELPAGERRKSMDAGRSDWLHPVGWSDLVQCSDAVPDWSVINWLFGIAVAGYVFLLFAYFWGRGAPSHFAFPILFVLLAIPWPQRIELVLVQALMKFVAATAAQ